MNTKKFETREKYLEFLKTRMIGNTFTSGKTWKVKDSSKMGNKAGKSFTKGKHWKVKDTSKMGKANKGKKLSVQHRINIGKSRKGKKQVWKDPVQRGKNISLANIGKRLGEKNPMWKDGISFETYSINWTNTLKRSIRERDKYICQLCNEQQNDKAFDVHHIDYDKKNCNPDNLITLCRSCHMKTNNKRDRWTEFFKKLKDIRLIKI